MLGLIDLVVICIFVVGLSTALCGIVAGHWNEAGLVCLLAAPETLPLITGHDVEMVVIVEVLEILCIGTQGSVTLSLLPVAVLSIVHTTWCGG